jgi:hypothetical protein
MQASKCAHAPWGVQRGRAPLERGSKGVSPLSVLLPGTPMQATRRCSQLWPHTLTPWERFSKCRHVLRSGSPFMRLRSDISGAVACITAKREPDLNLCAATLSSNGTIRSSHNLRSSHRLFTRHPSQRRTTARLASIDGGDAWQPTKRAGVLSLNCWPTSWRTSQRT